MNSLPFWKRCRVLASAPRLKVLTLLDERSRECVKFIAEELDVSDSVASRDLQLMQQAGFLEYERRGKFLYYSLADDPLSRLVLNASRDNEVDEIMFVLTAFTHERRLRILAQLDEGATRMERLGVESSIPFISLRRQVDKLVRRGFVEMKDGVCRAKKPVSSVGRELKKLAMKVSHL